MWAPLFSNSLGGAEHHGLHSIAARDLPLEAADRSDELVVAAVLHALAVVFDFTDPRTTNGSELLQQIGRIVGHGQAPGLR